MIKIFELFQLIFIIRFNKYCRKTYKIFIQILINNNVYDFTVVLSLMTFAKSNLQLLNVHMLCHIWRMMYALDFLRLIKASYKVTNASACTFISKDGKRQYVFTQYSVKFLRDLKAKKKKKFSVARTFLYHIQKQ